MWAKTSRRWKFANHNLMRSEEPKGRFQAVETVLFPQNIPSPAARDFFRAH